MPAGQGPARPLPVLGARHVLPERPLSPERGPEAAGGVRVAPVRVALEHRRVLAHRRAQRRAVLAADLAVRAGHPLVRDPLHHPLQPALVGRERVSGQRDDHRGGRLGAAGVERPPEGEARGLDGEDARAAAGGDRLRPVAGTGVDDDHLVGGGLGGETVERAPDRARLVARPDDDAGLHRAEG